MTDKWRLLAADLLDRAADEFSNHGCNDWSFPDSWTEYERRTFAYAAQVFNVGGRDLSETEAEEAEHMARGGMPDWFVMRFLAHCFRATSTRSES